MILDKEFKFVAPLVRPTYSAVDCNGLYRLEYSDILTIAEHIK